MASASLVIGQNQISAPQNTEASNSSAAEVILPNQPDKISFPQALKKVKGGTESKDGDSPTPDIVVPTIHTADATLPLSGMLLPLSLPQGFAASQGEAAVSGEQNVQSAANGGMPVLMALAGGVKGEGGKGGQQSLLPVSDKVSAKQQVAQQLSENSTANASSPSIVEEQSQVSAKTADFGTLVAPLQNNQLNSQALSHELAGIALDKHSGFIDASSHMGLDSANSLNALTQGTDKINQPPTMPSAISVPLKTPQWGDELGDRVMWMVKNDIQTANIKISPPHLGPLEVQISMKKDHVDVSFNSHHAAVKEALDASLPKLREMLGTSGLQLGDANVTHHSFSGQGQYGHQGTNHHFEEDGNITDTPNVDSDEIASTSISSWTGGPGVIDFYA